MTCAPAYARTHAPHKHFHVSDHACAFAHSLNSNAPSCNTCPLTNTNKHTQTYAHAHANTLTKHRTAQHSTHTHAYAGAHAHTLARTHIHAYTHTQKHRTAQHSTYTRSRWHTHVHTHVHTQVHTCGRTNAHIPARSRAGVSYELIAFHDPRRPLLIGGLGQDEDKLGVTKLRFKRHRWGATGRGGKQDCLTQAA